MECSGILEEIKLVLFQRSFPEQRKTGRLLYILESDGHSVLVKLLKHDKLTWTHTHTAT